MTRLDPRLHAVRPDLADRRLLGRVTAKRFAEGQCMQVTAAAASVRRAPRRDAMQTTEALKGEVVRVFEIDAGWAWGQLEGDGYVGYLSADDLSPAVTAPTHRVCVPATFIYPEASIKSQPAEAVTMNAGIAVAATDGAFCRLADGRCVHAGHLKPLPVAGGDFVAVAEMFLHVPYYWGGKTVRGLDCSGLVQLSLQACGMACPRDSDMQQVLGAGLDSGDLQSLRRGDLVFWKGHVGIMNDSRTLLHANGHHMMVVREPLSEAIARIAAAGSAVTHLRRLQ